MPTRYLGWCHVVIDFRLNVPYRNTTLSSSVDLQIFQVVETVLTFFERHLSTYFQFRGVTYLLHTRGNLRHRA
jgi:hypothetical protein